MAKGEVIETVYGKVNKHEVMKELGGVFSGPKFYVYRNGKYYRASFSSLRDAVEEAQKEAEREG